MEKIDDQKEIMVYMGSYVRDRSEGKYNDYVTYDSDSNITYNSYINLKSNRVYNIDKDEREGFERENIVIKMPVSVNSFDSYLSNYMNLRKWYLGQLEIRKEECITKELTRVSIYLTCHSYEQKDFKHARNGFIEKFCLSEEDRQVLQLSRKEREQK